MNSKQNKLKKLNISSIKRLSQKFEIKEVLFQEALNNNIISTNA